MNRREELTRYASKTGQGIEIAPRATPVAAKRAGYKCLVLDALDTETLRTRARAALSAAALEQIEDVDVIGPAGKICDLVAQKNLQGSIDYIVSSHIIESIPDPIRFLQACEQSLSDCGVLSLAVFDRRACSEFFRPHTTLASWLAAYFESRQAATPAQIFEKRSLDCRYSSGVELSEFFSLRDDPSAAVPSRCLAEAFETWKNHTADSDADTTHGSWAFTPASFELLINDLNFLGLIDLQLLAISETNKNEFFVHLGRPQTQPVRTSPDSDNFYRRRRCLLQRVNSEASSNSIESLRLRSELSHALELLSEEQKETARLRSGFKDLQEAFKQRINRIDRENKGRISNLENIIAGVERSRSWRATAPLRAGAKLFRKLNAGRISNTERSQI